MSKTISAKLLLVLFLGVVAIGAGVFAYGEPFGNYPANTTEPIDISGVNQVKVGPLSVFAFNARGNADFKQDLEIKGIAQGCNGMVCDPLVTPKPQTTVNVGTNLLARGDIKATGSWQADSLVHNTPSSPNYLPVCADANGIIVFCPGPTVPPPAVMCPNHPGVAADPNNPDITIDPVTGNCTLLIRGTIYAGLHGYVAVNMARTAMLADLYVKEIKIKSIGGDTTKTTWPTGVPPLAFNWGFCAKWNPAYTGPTIFNVTSSAPASANGNVSQGACFDFRDDYAYRSILPYGTWKYATENGRYTAWDGTHGMNPFWFNDAGTMKYIDDPHGFFDAKAYDTNGNMTTRVTPYQPLHTFIQLNKFTQGYMNFKFPLDKLVLNDVKVPAGYKLDLVSAPQGCVGSLCTDIDIHPVKNSAYIKNPTTPNLSRVNVYIPGGYGVDLPMGLRWANNLPNGTYQTAVFCSNPTHAGTASPSTFTIPQDGGVALDVSC